MTLRHLPAVEAVIGGLGRSARAFAQRAALMAAAAVIGATGGGFVMFAAFAALRRLIGAELAALSVGIVLLALAGLLVHHIQGRASKASAGAALPPDAPAPLADGATMAAFTAAFVLGRHLADRWRD